MTLSKKLKRRIQELCGLSDLSQEDRLVRAEEILSSNELKQSISNEILGVTFKDIERAMRSVIAEKRPSREEQDQLELELAAPEKFEEPAPLPFKSKKPVKKKYTRPLTQEEVTTLIEASKEQVKLERPPRSLDYHTYTHEQIQGMVEEYISRRVQYDERRSKNKR